MDIVHCCSKLCTTRFVQSTTQCKVRWTLVKHWVDNWTYMRVYCNVQHIQGTTKCNSGWTLFALPGSHWCEVGATSREDMKGVAVASDPWHSVPCLCVHILFVSVYSVWNAWCAGVWVSGLVEGTHEGRDGLVTHAAHPPLHVRPPWFSKVFGGTDCDTFYWRFT